MLVALQKLKDVRLSFEQNILARPQDENFGVTKYVPLGDLEQLFQSDRYKALTERVRTLDVAFHAEKDPKKKDILKGKKQKIKTGFSALIASAKIEIGLHHRDVDNCGHTGVFSLDIDDVKPSSRQRIWEILENDPVFKFLFASPSGGPKILVPTAFDDVSLHEAAFEQVFQYYYDLFASHGLRIGNNPKKQPNCDLYLDHSGKNIARLVYVSYSPESKFCGDDLFTVDHDAAQAWIAQEERRAIELSSKYQDTPDALLEDIYNFLQSKGASITVERPNWIAVMIGLIHSFDLDTARTYAHKFSSLDDCYKESETDYYFENVLGTVNRSSHGKPATVGTIIYLAKQEGYKIPKGFRTARANLNQYTAPIGPYPRFLSVYNDEILGRFEHGKKLSLEAPTGSGKTYGTLAPDGWLKKKVESDKGSVGRFFVPI